MRAYVVFGRHLLGKSVGIADNEAQTAGCDALKRLHAQDAVGFVGLAILYVAFIAGRKHRHRLLAAKAHKVEIEIAGIVERIAHHEYRFFTRGHRSEHHSRRRTRQPVGRDASAFNGGAHRLGACRRHEAGGEFSEQHRRMSCFRARFRGGAAGRGIPPENEAAGGPGRASGRPAANGALYRSPKSIAWKSRRRVFP